MRNRDRDSDSGLAVQAWGLVFIASVLVVMAGGGGIAAVAAAYHFFTTLQTVMLASTLASLACCGVGILGLMALMPERTNL